MIIKEGGGGLTTLVLVWLCGCSGSDSSEVAEILARVRGQGTGEPLAPQACHLGPILAHEQTLGHDFVLKNPEERTVRLIRAEALTPCCSLVRSLPASIPARGEATVAVELKVGRSTGRKSVSFLVETDSPDHPRVVLTLTAELYADWEISTTDPALVRTLAGAPAEMRFQVACRRDGSAGLETPNRIETSPTLKAEFEEGVESRLIAGGIRQTSRTVKVEIPASRTVGSHREQILFSWEDGRREARDITYIVEPLLVPRPSTIVLRAGEEPVVFQKLAITSAGPPFRILDVASPLLAKPIQPPPDAAQSHEVTLKLTSPPEDFTADPSIQVKTDCVDQPIQSIPVLVLPRSKQ